MTWPPSRRKGQRWGASRVLQRSHTERVRSVGFRSPRLLCPCRWPQDVTPDFSFAPWRSNSEARPHARDGRSPSSEVSQAQVYLLSSFQSTKCYRCNEARETVLTCSGFFASTSHRTCNAADSHCIVVFGRLPNQFISSAIESNETSVALATSNLPCMSRAWPPDSSHSGLEIVCPRFPGISPNSLDVSPPTCPHVVSSLDRLM